MKKVSVQLVVIWMFDEKSWFFSFQQLSALSLIFKAS